jgi:hypothetical protein
LAARAKGECIQDHVTHSAAKVYSDAALAGLWGIRSLPKVEMTIVAALDRDDSIQPSVMPGATDLALLTGIFTIQWLEQSGIIFPWA